MKTLEHFKTQPLQYIFTDIDDTLTDDGRLGPEAYASLWNLFEAGFKIIPVTGRPAGWCEMIARQWPVAGVVGENGGFYFRLEKGKMKRHFIQDADTREKNQERLKTLGQLVLNEVPEAGLSSDQFTRLVDIAIDYCEDRPRLSDKKINQIMAILKDAGMQVKLSSIHINAWFGNYDKSSTCFLFLKNEFQLSRAQAIEVSAFCGDSPNDEPLFRDFKFSFAVANIKNFLDKLEHLPSYVSTSPGGKGFVEIANTLVSRRGL